MSKNFYVEVTEDEKNQLRVIRYLTEEQFKANKDILNPMVYRANFEEWRIGYGTAV